jgi:hypothetical protein
MVKNHRVRRSGHGLSGKLKPETRKGAPGIGVHTEQRIDVQDQNRNFQIFQYHGVRADETGVPRKFYSDT